MLRRVLLIMSVVGLVGTLGLCGLSYFNVGLSFRAGSALPDLDVSWGCLSVSRLPPSYNMGVSSLYWRGFRKFETYWWPPGGFHRSGYWGWYVTLPLWMPVLASAASLSLLLFRRRRHRLGLCVACGYDLRGSPGKCPECGHGR
jgi:hypothetical protein